MLFRSEDGGDYDRESLRDLLQSDVFGQGDDGSNKGKKEEAWSKPFLSFFDEARKNMFGTDTNTTADRTADDDVRDPFFTFFDAIRQTKDFLQGKMLMLV